jgi:hypothetical protein
MNAMIDHILILREVAANQNDSRNKADKRKATR